MVEALDVYDCELTGIRLIEASAGTGKTWAICGLYLRLLLERGHPVERILVVSFTKAATAELRERIRSRIAETLARLDHQGPESRDPFATRLLDTLRSRGLADRTLRDRLQLALQSFDEAAIFTIHGFCKRALDDTPFTTGMPLALEQIADDSELQREVAQDFWRRRVAAAALQPGLARLLADRRDSPDRFAEQLKRRLAKPLARLVWPDDLDAADGVDVDGLERAHARARCEWQSERDRILAIVQAALPGLHKSSYKPAAIAEAVRSWDQMLASAAAVDAPFTLPKLDLLTPTRLEPNVGKPRVAPHAFFQLAADLLQAREGFEQAAARARLRLLRDLLDEAPGRLRDLKRQRRVLAYDDLLANLHDRLRSGRYPTLGASLRERFPAALIDEFQDTDPLQFDIFRGIYAGGDSDASLFLVGDPKQAIYNFRNADLHVYLRAHDEARAVYTLTENRRSTRPMLAALNALFGQQPRAFMVPGLEYRALAYGERARRELDVRSGPGVSLRLWMLPRAADGQPAVAGAARERAAQATAGEIARLLGASRCGELMLSGRPLAGRDIAVLVPTHARGRQVREALATLGVGAVELSNESVFASVEAEELERLLVALLDPGEPGLVRAALSTQLLGADAAAIERLAVDEQQGLGLIERFCAYRDTWSRRGIGVMLHQFMATERVAARLLSLPYGERRLTNLLHLVEVLQGAAAEHGSADALLRWFRMGRAEPRPGDETQVRLESERDLVQIVTLHAAKGLEYPVVFCPFLWDSFLDATPPGPGLEYHDADGRLVIDFTPQARDLPEIKARRSRERAEERLRLIYVALTRAVNRCYLVVGAYRKKASTRECTRAALNWWVADPAVTPEQWFAGERRPEDLEAWWSGWAESTPDASLDPLPSGPFAALQGDLPAPEAIVARPPPARIPPGWRIGSYSALSFGARHDDAAIDHDLRVPVPAATSQPVAIPDDDILRFPRGTVAGDCIHAVFERIDFGSPSGWSAAIDEALRRQPQAPADPGARARLPDMLLGMLSDVVATTLPGGFCLREVRPDRRLTELEFNAPASDVTAAGLNDLLRRHGYGGPRLQFHALQGYLRGFIDLVFEHDGRFYIVDWKSNHLGDDAEHYGRRAVASAMEQGGYHLQYLLYVVAVDRHLRQQVPGYRYADHFGGVLYLFIRGVRPRWRDVDGHPSGVYAHKPSSDVVEELSALLTSSRVRA